MVLFSDATAVRRHLKSVNSQLMNLFDIDGAMPSNVPAGNASFCARTSDDNFFEEWCPEIRHKVSYNTLSR